MTLSISTYCQEPISVNFTPKDGLASFQVYDIYQDKNGLMWFGTDRGLSCFNGEKFKNFGKDEGLTDLRINHFFPQKDGYVWCSSIGNSFFYFHEDSLIIHPYKYNNQLIDLGEKDPLNFQLLEDGSIKVFFKRIAGFVKITNNGTLINKSYYRNDNNSTYLVVDKTKFTYTSEKSIIGCDNFLYKISTNYSSYYSDSIILLGHNYGFDIVSKEGKTTAVKSNNFDIGVGVSENLIWYASMHEGISLYSTSGVFVQNILEGKSCTKYFVDDAGGVWVTTLESGVYYYNNFTFKQIFIADDSYITDLSVYKDSILYIGGYSGEIYSYNNGELSTVGYSCTHGVLNYYKHINKILFQGDHLLVDLNIKKIKDITCFLKFSDNPDKKSLLIHRNSVVDENLRVLTTVKDQSIMDAEWFDNQVYIGKKNGLIKLENNKQVYLSSFSNNYTVNDLDVLNNYLIIGTKGGGCIIRDKNGQETLINHKNGLNSDIINEVVIENDSIFWLCTQKGISRVYFVNNKPIIQNIKLPIFNNDIEVIDLAIIKDEIYIATRFGLYVHPLSIIRNTSDRKRHLYLKLNSVKANNIHFEDLSSLSHNQNRIEIDLQAVDFSQHKKITYRYKLIGVDKVWNITSDPTILYESLPPGNFKLIVNAGLDRNWTDEIIKIPINISTPYYNTLWFYTLLILFIISIIWVFFKYRVLSYNREIIREILRYTLKRIKKNSKDFIVRSNGYNVRINSLDVLYVESKGNYIYIITDSKKIPVRETLSNFNKIVPDPIEYIQIRRSIIIRIDKVESKSVNTVVIGKNELKVGRTLLGELDKIHL